MKINRKKSGLTSASSSHKSNVSFAGSGKVSVSVANIINSAAVRQQVKSVKKIAASQALKQTASEPM